MFGFYISVIGIPYVAPDMTPRKRPTERLHPMTSKRQEFLHHVRTAITAEGATVISCDTTGGSHRRITFEIAGRRGRVIISNTPSRGRDLKAIATARRVVRATEGGAR